MTRLYVFPKSTLVPLHQFTEPNVGAGGGAAEEEGRGAATCGELPSGSPSVADTTQATQVAGQTKAGKAACVAETALNGPLYRLTRLLKGWGWITVVQRKCYREHLKERFLKTVMCLLADSWCQPGSPSLPFD